MATAATIKKNIAKLEAALKSKATPKTLKPKLEAQLVKSKAELSGIKKGTKPKTSSTKSTQTALQKLKEMVNKNKKFKTYKGAGVDLEKDADRPALKTGKRTAKKSGNTYYEYRANRIDVKQPPKKYPKLEKGGYMADGGTTSSFSNARLLGRESQDFEKEARKYAGADWDKMSKDEKEQIISDMQKDFDRSSHFAKGGYMADGGEIENQYEDKIGMEVWGEWSFEQRVHFLTDHKDHVYKYGKLYDTKEEKFELAKKKFKELPRDLRVAIEDHVESGQYAKGGKTKKGDVGKSGTQYGYTLKEYEEMGEKNGLFVSPKEWWSSREGKKYTDSLGRTKTIGSNSQDERQEMQSYGYRIAIGMDLGSDKIPESARKYVIENNLTKEKGGYMAKGGLTEHGLKVGDTIVDNMFWDKSVKVLNSKTGYAVVHLETGERKEMKAMGGEMHRTQE
jgi:hypothetical protein